MVAFYSALLAVVLCGTISAAEKVEKERVSSLSFFCAEHRKRGLYTGLVKYQGGNILSETYLEKRSHFFGKTKLVSGKVRVKKIKPSKNMLISSFSDNYGKPDGDGFTVILLSPLLTIITSVISNNGAHGCVLV